MTPSTFWPADPLHVHNTPLDMISSTKFLLPGLNVQVGKSKLNLDFSTRLIVVIVLVLMIKCVNAVVIA